MKADEKLLYENFNVDPITDMTDKICQRFEINPETLSIVRTHVGAKQEDVALTRQVVVYYTVRYFQAYHPDWTQTRVYNKVGELVKRDRATIIHSLKVIENYLFSDRRMFNIISEMNGKFEKYLPESEKVRHKHESILNQRFK